MTSPNAAGAPSGRCAALRASSQTASPRSAAAGMSVPVTLETAIPAGQSAHQRPATKAAPRPKMARAVP